MLDGCVAAVLQRHGRFVALSGEGGIGKTRLLDHALAAAADAGVRTASAGGVALTRTPPYGTVAAALRPLFDALPAWEQRRLGDERLELLAYVLAAGQAPASAAQRWRCHRAVRDLLGLLSEERPLLLALDDVHEADVATVELLAYLVRRAPVAGLGVAIAYRPREVDAMLDDIVHVAAADGAVSLLAPAPLSEQESAALLDREADPAAVRGLHRQSGGNPFYLQALSRAGARADAGGRIPAPLAGTLVAEAADLDAPSRRLLEAGSLLGEQFDVDVAAAIAELPEADALSAYDVLAERALVRPVANGRAATFRHPLLRRAIHDAVADDDARELHRRAAVELQRRGAALAAVAHHTERSAAPGDRAAIGLLVTAATRASAAAPSDAATWLAGAHRLLGPDASDAERLALLMPLAQALMTSGRDDEARDALTQALRLDDAVLAPVRATIVTMLVGLDVRTGCAEQGRDLLLRELWGVGDDRPGDASALRLRLAMSHFVGNDVPAAIGEAEQALALAQRATDGFVAGPSGFLACLCVYDGDLRRAQRLADAALAGLDGLGDEQLVAQFDVLVALGHALIAAERHAEAARLLVRGLGLARGIGAFPYVEIHVCHLADARRRQGRLDAAAELVDEGLEAALVTGNAFSRLQHLIVATDLAIDRGRADAAVEAADAAVALALAMPGAPNAWTAHAVRGAALLEAGRPAAAREALLEAGGDGLRAIPAGFRSRWLVAMARAELAAGRADHARTWAQQADAATVPLELAGRTADVLRLRAELALAGRLPREAVELASEAARRHLAADMPVEATRDDLLAAEAYTMLDARSSADRRLRQAHALAFDAGAHGLRDAAERALRRPSDRSSPGVGLQLRADAIAELTPRERRIATCIGKGATNREIAAELQVSARTVERLVTVVRRKLGMPSRAAVAALVASRPDEFG